MKKIVCLITVITISFFTLTVFAQSVQPKTKLKVLFVGYDPSRPMPEAEHAFPGMMTKEGFAADYPRRMPSFKKLLTTYFTEVKTIDCRDWKPADSDPYDVTIFDFRPKVIEEAREVKNADGSEDYFPPKFLPDNFSKPVVFIASTAGEMGSSIGLKLDWLCLCLYAHAHHFNANHPIFNGPVQKAKMTIELKETPENIFHYTSGKNVPKQIPMWKVQEVNLENDHNARIGLVSRGERFTEGPDAEVISSGVCQKDVGAVALGRHGNFFLWGFGASPAQMTEEGKVVFVNVVAYMKQFDKKTPITRKYNDRMATTDYVMEEIGQLSKESYDKYVQTITELKENNTKEMKRIQEKRAAGNELTESEKESLNYLAISQPIDSWEDYLKRNMKDYYEQYGNDAPSFQKYLTDNLKYIYCDPKGFCAYTIDEDVKKIGISNHDVALLDKCVDMLKRNEDQVLALRVLKKYTAMDFTTVKEWNEWLTKNRNKLYFTETDGYRFKVNTYN